MNIKFYLLDKRKSLLGLEFDSIKNITYNDDNNKLVSQELALVSIGFIFFYFEFSFKLSETQLDEDTDYDQYLEYL